MSTPQILVAGRTASGGVSVTWNPSDFNAAFTLSGGNLVAVRTGSDGWVSGRATHSFTTGKYYFGVRIGGAGSDAGLMVGLSDAAMPLTNFCGNDGFGFGYNSNAGDKYNGGGPLSFGAAFGGGDHIGVAWNATNGDMWFALNNTWQGTSADPAAGTGAAFSPGGATNLYPTISGYFGAGTHNFTGQFKIADSSYTPPTGFSMVGT